MSEPQRKSSCFLYIAALLINIGALMGGVATTWSSSAIPKLSGQKPGENPLTDPATTSELSLIAAMLNAGLLLGPFCAISMDKIGRKKSLFLISIHFCFNFLLTAFTRTVWLFYIARFSFGISNGWMLVVIPNYLSEIAEKHNRGTLNGLLKVSIAFGMFLTYCMGPYLSIFLSSIVCIIPIVFISILIAIYVPESPHYLVAKGDTTGAELALVKLRRHLDVLKELEEIVLNVEESRKRKGSLWEILTNFALFKCLFIGLGLMLFQQLSGPTAVLFYLQTIFESTGSTLSPEISAIIVGFVQFLSSIISPMLVDRLGRRFFLLVSGLGSIFCLIILGVYFHLKNNNYPVDNINWLPIASLIVYFISYAIGFGILPYTIISEIFPPNFKALACSLAVMCLGVTSFFITLTFPLLTESIGMAKSFWTFAGCSAIGVLFVYFCVPETKNKSFLEIQKMLKVYHQEN